MKFHAYFHMKSAKHLGMDQAIFMVVEPKSAQSDQSLYVCGVCVRDDCRHLVDEKGHPKSRTHPEHAGCSHRTIGLMAGRAIPAT